MPDLDVEHARFERCADYAISIADEGSFSSFATALTFAPDAHGENGAIAFERGDAIATLPEGDYPPGRSGDAVLVGSGYRVPLARDSTWLPRTRYRLEDGVTLHVNAALELSPGTQFAMGTNARIVIGDTARGALRAIGTDAQRVQITAADEGTRWAGLRFGPHADLEHSSLAYVTLSGGHGLHRNDRCARPVRDERALLNFEEMPTPSMLTHVRFESWDADALVALDAVGTAPDLFAVTNENEIGATQGAAACRETGPIDASGACASAHACP
jgi:hypothetical protein